MAVDRIIICAVIGTLLVLYVCRSIKKRSELSLNKMTSLIFCGAGIFGGLVILCSIFSPKLQKLISEQWLYQLAGGIGALYVSVYGAISEIYPELISSDKKQAA